jgi:hypothetical protein
LDADPSVAAIQDLLPQNSAKFLEESVNTSLTVPELLESTVMRDVALRPVNRFRLPVEELVQFREYGIEAIYLHNGPSSKCIVESRQAAQGVSSHRPV